MWQVTHTHPLSREFAFAMLKMDCPICSDGMTSAEGQWAVLRHNEDSCTGGELSENQMSAQSGDKACDFFTPLDT